MEKNSLRLEYKVGIFIVVGLIAVMATILMLGGQKTFFTSYTRLNARFGEVSGLFPGSVVSLAGLPVGNVEDIKFSGADNKLDVTLKIDRKFEKRLVEGTIAEVRTQGALGDKYIYLEPGPVGSKQLADGSTVQANEADLMKLLTSREDGVARIVDLIKELHILVASINQNGQIAVTMKNMGDASKKLGSTLAQLDGLLGDIRGEIPQNHKLRTALTSLSSVLEKIDSGKGTLGVLVNDPSIAQSMKSLLGPSPRNKYMKEMLRETLQQSGSK
ncbi:MAG: MCE family protein [Proteobacteria bacterium]|nr:MAG: MCE family protein [Pseudomonadota bacterium]